MSRSHTATGRATVSRTALASIMIACASVTSITSVALLGGCRGEPEQVRGGSTGPVALPPDSLLASVPVGDLAGATPNRLATTITNPYENNLGAITEGKDLMTQMNCVGCHGYNLKGGMGPNLVDTYWRYGGSPAEIYKSIYEGRPEGMPAWGAALTHDQIWKIVAYLQSQGGTFPARLAEAGRQGNLGDEDTTAGSTLKGRQNEH